MTRLLIIVVWSLLSWRAEYYESIAKVQIIRHQPPCDVAAWVGPDAIIHLCHPPEPEYGRWIIVHELQHLLAGHNLVVHDWDKFERAAMKALRQGNYTKAEVESAKYYASYGAWELHAELPAITKGNIPSCLQGWYPWFDLERREKTK